MQSSRPSLRWLLALAVLPVVLAGCVAASGAMARKSSAVGSGKTPSGLYLVKGARLPLPKNVEYARFAGGCFWGVEQYFRQEPGVIATAVGFSGGHVPNPSYERVCENDTGHAESVELAFDPAKTSYQKLVTLFFEIHDPTELDRQGPDVGTQYRSVAFYRTPEQKRILDDAIADLQKSPDFKDAKIVTEVVPAGPFYFAENYHQQYVEKGGIASCHVRKPHPLQ